MESGNDTDFVLDNAGFELYCDFVYADWLIQSGIAKKIKFHGKRLPCSFFRRSLFVFGADLDMRLRRVRLGRPIVSRRVSLSISTRT